MNELLLRRRVARMDSGPTEKSYIQDGLVFQLDGINKGSNVGYWTDIVGGKKFEFNQHVTVNANNVQCLGTGYLTIDTNIGYARSSHTIEVVCSVSNGVVLGPTRTNIGFGFSSGKIVYYFGYSQSGPAYAVNSTSVSTFSVRDSLVMQNFQQLTSNSNGAFTYNNPTMCIGAERNSSGKTRNIYTGYIYAIRIYNRHLTADEILFNHNIDNERFNLGLTI